MLACTLVAEPEDRDRLVESPAARQRFVDEALRWESPIGAVTREARVDTTLAGTRIPRATRVLGALGAPTAPRPGGGDRTVPRRGDRAHLSFGAGMHGCIGAVLTRHLADAVILAVSTDPTVRLLAEPEYRGWRYRGPAAVPVAWS